MKVRTDFDLLTKSVHDLTCQQSRWRFAGLDLPQRGSLAFSKGLSAMQQLVSNDVGLVVESQIAPVEAPKRVAHATAVTAATDAANAWSEGQSAQYRAAWAYMNTVGRVSDDGVRGEHDKDFGEQFRSVYAAALVKTYRSTDPAAAAKKSLSRLRSLVKRVLTAHDKAGLDWAVTLNGPDDLVRFTTQTEADQAAAIERNKASRVSQAKKGGAVPSEAADPSGAEGKPIASGQRALLIAAFESFCTVLGDEVTVAFPNGGAKHRYETSWAALRSSMAQIGWKAE